MRGGYYVHIQPGQCMFAAGIWDPGKELLKALRSEIEANYEEVEAIMGSRQWKKYFAQDFDTYWGTGLKKVPAGFDPEFVHAEWLKHKMYTFSVPLSDEEVISTDFIDKITDIAKAAKPMNDFLNYTFEEYGEFPTRRSVHEQKESGILCSMERKNARDLRHLGSVRGAGQRRHGRKI